MTHGRRLTEPEWLLVSAMRERARIRAEITWLEIKVRRIRNLGATEQHLVDLRARLVAMDTTMDQVYSKNGSGT